MIGVSNWNIPTQSTCGGSLESRDVIKQAVSVFGNHYFFFIQYFVIFGK